MTSFGKLLKSYRVQAGLTQPALAKLAKVSVRTVENLESGAHRKAHLTTAGLLADALGLTGGEDRATFITAAVSGRTADGTPEIAQSEVGREPEVRHTLPRAPTAFTGRDDELQALITAVEEGARPGRPVLIFAIDGMAGVGKTALALQAAHMLADRFPDGQLFVRLHAHTPNRRPSRPGDVLRALLRETGMDARQIPSAMDEKERLWRDRLASKRLVLVLDDADSSDQVEPLVPGVSGSVVLVTSRRRLDGLDGVQPIPLDVLPQDQAVRLFGKLSGRANAESEIAADLVRLGGFLPLAIRLLAGRLRHSPVWTVSDLADDLATARDRSAAIGAADQSLSALFDLSYRRLGPGRRRFFRHLGLHPGTEIDAYAAAALTGHSLADARTELAGLFRDHLIEEPARGRYRFHDLIGDYARTLAADIPQSDKDTATDRLLDYYLRTTRLADRYLARHRHSVPPSPAVSMREISNWEDAAVWMTAEHPNLRAVVDYAAALGRRDYVVSISPALNGFLHTYGHWDEALALHAMALEAAREMGDERAEADAWLDIGSAQHMTADYATARESLTRALKRYDAVDDTLGRANVFYYLGLVYRLGGEITAAIDSLSRAFDLYGAMNAVLGQASALNEMGYARCLIGELNTAEENLTRGLDLHKELGHRNGQACALNYLGVVQQQLGDYAASVASQERALALFSELGNRNGEANALNYLAHAQYDMGDYHLAHANATQALERYQSVGNRLGATNALRFIGRTLLAMGDSAAALVNATEALASHQAMNEPLGEANDYSLLGDIQYERAYYAAAEASFSEALRRYQNVGERSGVAGTLNKMGQTILAYGEPARALTYYEQALAVAQEISSRIEEERALKGIERCRLENE
jgi:tetratricopeptide (TPR) repeat protein/transcriptional regulator with XRE-family HTH domain